MPTELFRTPASCYHPAAKTERAPNRARSTLFRGLPLIAHGLLAERYKLLGRGRMHGHDRVEIRLGRPHLHGDADELDHLGRVGADDVTTYDPVVSSINN